jgi:hypothetical protein
MQICSGFTSAAYLREHNCESVLRTRQLVPGTAWIVEMLQVTNRYAREGSKSAVRRLHTVRRTKTQMCPIPQKPASVVLLLRLSLLAFHTMVAVS